jgi:YesN/AraC family two-component response regulator
LIFFIGFFGIRQVGIFHVNKSAPTLVLKDPELSVVNESEITAKENSREKRKYQKSGLTANHSKQLHLDLAAIMTSEKLFRENELTLVELARRLNTQPNYLSQVINEHEGKIFYDYINNLRIAEFIRLVALPENRKYTLVALAELCGFNSKSSFNRHFKKVTGQSPSDFIKTVSVSEN